MAFAVLFDITPEGFQPYLAEMLQASLTPDDPEQEDSGDIPMKDLNEGELREVAESMNLHALEQAGTEALLQLFMTWSQTQNG